MVVGPEFFSDLSCAGGSLTTGRASFAGKARSEKSNQEATHSSSRFAGGWA